jgi:WD40 repeat protein
MPRLHWVDRAEFQQGWVGGQRLWGSEECGAARGTRSCWDTQRGTYLRTIQARTGGVCSISLSPDGTMLASGRGIRSREACSSYVSSIEDTHQGRAVSALREHRKMMAHKTEYLV